MKISFLGLLLCFAGSASAQLANQKCDLGAFSAINISGGFHSLTLVPGDKECLEIQAEKTAPEGVDYTVNNNTLSIARKNKGFQGAKIRLVVTYRNLERINNSGSTDIYANTALRTPDLEYNISGSGDFHGEIDTDALHVRISGSGDVRLEGRADQIDFLGSGSGDFLTGNLKAQKGKVVLSGSGDAVVNVQGDLNVIVSGSGEVKNKSSNH